MSHAILVPVNGAGTGNRAAGHLYGPHVTEFFPAPGDTCRNRRGTCP